MDVPDPEKAPLRAFMFTIDSPGMTAISKAYRLARALHPNPNIADGVSPIDTDIQIISDGTPGDSQTTLRVVSTRPDVLARNIQALINYQMDVENMDVLLAGIPELALDPIGSSTELDSLLLDEAEGRTLSTLQDALEIHLRSW